MSLRPLTTLLRHVLAGVVTIAAGLIVWTVVYLARHVLAGVVTIAAGLIVWTVVYLALLLWALLTDSGLGGPLAYPIGLLSASTGGVPSAPPSSPVPSTSSAGNSGPRPISRCAIAQGTTEDPQSINNTKSPVTSTQSIPPSHLPPPSSSFLP